MKKLWYLILAAFAVSCGQTAQAAGYCKDNIPGVCASSPFCVGKKIGAACRTNRACKALGKKKIGDCCSCSRGKAISYGHPMPRDPSRPVVPYGYHFPDFSHKSGDLPMGMPYEPYDFNKGKEVE